MNNSHIHLPACRLALVLASVATFLAIQSIVLRVVQYRVGVQNSYWLYQYGELMNVNREANVPTWFSASLLLAAALLLLTITLSLRAGGRPYKAWAGLTGIFAYISMDEAGTIHEKLTPILQEQLSLTGYFYFGWIVVGISVALGVGLLYLPFVWRLPTDVRRWFILAGALYVGGALGIESISANLWYLDGGASLRFSAVGTVEEWFEMLGVITLIYGLLTYIRVEVGTVKFSVSQAVASSQARLPAATPKAYHDAHPKGSGARVSDSPI
ncbi:MAG: hypothetical protein KJZ93_05630 [Caldilineaceae bacterium]|nr:hypothetical protein [Caldilineaceae bacterium]